MRAALYWVPAAHDPLFAAGSAWLGRDIRSGTVLRRSPASPIWPR